ncbi:MAG: alpha/beta hydrolase, partial [Gemmatimonadota bacterium]
MSSELTNASGRDWSRRRFVWTGLGAIAAPVFAGCSEDSPTEPTPAADPRFKSRPGIPTLAAPEGRTALGLSTARDGFLYVPSNYSPDTPAPLFVALHGFGATSDDWRGYIDHAEARGFVLLAPDSRSISWTDADSIAADVAFIDAALQHTFDRCRIDPGHIAFAGFSDGASYAISLGVSNGDLFTNILVHSGGFYWPASPIVGKPAVFQSHGTNDQILSIALARSMEAQLVAEGYDV